LIDTGVNIERNISHVEMNAPAPPIKRNEVNASNADARI